MRDRNFEAWIKDHWKRNSDPYHNSSFYLAACAQGEAGELFRVIKKACKVQGTSYPSLSAEQFKEMILEAGDTIHYCVRLLQMHGVSFEEILERNYEKLIDRYGR